MGKAADKKAPTEWWQGTEKKPGKKKPDFEGLSSYFVSETTGFFVGIFHSIEPEKYYHPDNAPFQTFAEHLAEEIGHAITSQQPTDTNARLINDPGLRQRMKTALGDKVFNTAILREKSPVYPLIGMRDLAFLANAWIHCSDPPATEVPNFLAEPLQALANGLGIPPIASYLHYVLVNGIVKFDDLKSKSPDDAVPDDFEVNRVFTDWRDEKYFYQIHQAIEVRGARAIRGMAIAASILHDDTIDSDEKNNRLALTLREIEGALKNMTQVFNDMRKFVDPHVFFDGFRPFLAGTEDIKGDHGDGVTYRTRIPGKGSDLPLRMAGGSGAQSDLIKMLDQFFQVNHTDPTIVAFLQKTEAYSIPPHRSLLKAVGKDGQLLRQQDLSESAKEAFDKCCLALADFRRVHRKVVLEFIPERVTKGTGGSYFGLFLRHTELASLRAAFSPNVRRINILERDIAGLEKGKSGGEIIP